MIYRLGSARHDTPSPDSVSHVSACKCGRGGAWRSWSHSWFSPWIILDLSAISISAWILPASAGTRFDPRNRHPARWSFWLLAYELGYHVVCVFIKFDVYRCRYVHDRIHLSTQLSNSDQGRMTSMRGLVAYPMVLFYGSFGIMAIFSSRGTGQLAKVAGT